MRKLIFLLTTLLGISPQASSEELKVTALDYEKLILLDAEDLAEQGILEAYNDLKGELIKYIKKPASIEEQIDNNIPVYKVASQGEVFDIYGPNIDGTEGRSWGRATFALFKIINNQLDGSEVKFYAINGGNELGGIFLTDREYEAAIKSLPIKTDWPYMPKLEYPWYGQPN